MATSRGQRPRNWVGRGIRHEGGGGNRAISSAPSGAHAVLGGNPGALPPASGRRPFGPGTICVCLLSLTLMGCCPRLVTVGTPGQSSWART